jgi:hypothetical protein
VVVNGDGVVKTVEHSIVVKDCYLSEIYAEEGKKDACPKDILKFEFNLYNSGEYQDRYNLRVEGQAKDWVSLSESSVILNSKESKLIYAYVSVPSDALGVYGFSVVSESLSTGEVSGGEADISVVGCYDYNVEVENNYYSFCEHTHEIIPIVINNKGTVSNIYKLGVSGPAWANLDKKELSIEEGAGATSNLILAPDYGVEGNFDITIRIVPEKALLEGISVINVDVNKCHSLSIDILENKGVICNLASNVYDIIVGNNGEVDKELKLELDGPEFVSLTELGPFSLKPGETKSIGLDVHPTISEAREYNVKVRAVAMDESRVEVEDSILIDVVSIAECYNPELKVEQKEVIIDRDGTASVAITVENNGLGKAFYEIGLSGSASGFVQLNPGSMELDSGRSEVVYAYIAPSSQVSLGNYDAIVSVRLADSTIIKSEKISINIIESGVDGVEEVVEEERAGLWTRIKQFFTNLFKPEEETTGEKIITEIPEIIEGEEVVEKIPEEIVEEEIVEEELVEEVSEEIIEEAELEEAGLDIELNFAVIKEGKLSGIEDSVASFSLDGIILHEIKVESVGEDGATLVISSEPQTLDFVIGESKEVDVDGDGLNDLIVTLEGVSDGRANFDIKRIELGVTEEKETLLEVIKEVLLLYKNYILAGIIILLLIILALKTNIYKKLIEFFEEEEEEDKKKKGKKKKKTEEEEIEELLEEDF